MSMPNETKKLWVAYIFFFFTFTFIRILILAFNSTLPIWLSAYYLVLRT